MPLPVRTAWVLAAGLLAFPTAVPAQGTAPAQGVERPMQQAAPPEGPPAPKPGEITDGRPREDPGGGKTDTSPASTEKTPLPPPGQADPPPPR